MSNSNIEIADIFRQYDHLLPILSKRKYKVINAIKNCRTEVLGGQKYKCNKCNHMKYVYHSCRNRHCPKCQFLARMKWIESRTRDLLPCKYFHVVFTIPSQLRVVFRSNPKECYSILFKAAAMTLKEVAENPKNLGADIGFIGVLHTWAQNLIDHPHVHFIVPGGGLNKKKTRWIASPDNYFLPVKVLSLVFRAKCLSLLEDSFDNDKLSFWGVNDLLKEAEHFKSLLKDCTKKDWIVYAKKPFAGPKQVINYLGGYTHRIAISNYRLEKVENEVVYFKVRDKDNPGKNKVISLGVKEFMRRFLLHVLPNKFVRIRHFGILGTRMKKEKMELIRKLEGMVEYIQENLFEKWEDQLKRLSGIEVNVCPKCKIGQLIETEKIKGLLSLNTC